MPVLILIFISLLLVGYKIVRSCTTVCRLELLLPTSLVIGTAIFIFLLNSTAFISRGPVGLYLSLFLFICIGMGLKMKRQKDKVNFPTGKALGLILLSLLGWSLLVLWKANHPILGSDRNIYYSVAKTFAVGNFPINTPWQPDVSLSYHVGGAELLGFLNMVTKLDFEFLHLVLSSAFLISGASILVAIIGKIDSVLNFIWGNVLALVGFICLGIITIPHIPFNTSPLLETDSINKIIVLLRNLPGPQQALGSYGIVLDLDASIYVLHYSVGIAILLATAVFSIYAKKQKISLFVLLAALSALALVNETIFIPSVAPLLLVYLLKFSRKQLIEKMKFIFVSLALFFGVILLQGGVVSQAFSSRINATNTYHVFPSINTEIGKYFSDYHKSQEITKKINGLGVWSNQNFTHIGLDLYALIFVSMLLFYLLKHRNRNIYHDKKLLFAVCMFLSAVSAIVVYNALIPRFISSNADRIIVYAYWSMALSICVLFINIAQRQRYVAQLIAVFVALLIVCTSALQSMAVITGRRFGDGMLYPKIQEIDPIFKWINKNTDVHDRFVSLDINSPHPSAAVELMRKTGRMVPTFAGGFRTYMIDASPEYIDITYTLSPAALNVLSADYLIIGKSFFGKLPLIRQQQLGDPNLFDVVYEDGGYDWRRVYKIHDKFLADGGELPGTLAELAEIAPRDGVFFIDYENNFDPNYLRRAVIFTLRGRDLVFDIGSGIYQHVETEIPFRQPQENDTYKYLLLGGNSVSEVDCNCGLIWAAADCRFALWGEIHPK